MNRHVRGVVCTLLGGTFWGFSGACGQFLFSKNAVSSQGLTVMRMLGAGSALVLFSLLTKRDALKRMFTTKTDARRLLIFALFGLMFSQFAYLTAISHSNAGTATVLQYLGPVFILVLVCIKGRRLPNAPEAIAITLAVLGTFLLATHGSIDNMVLSPSGLCWGLLAAVSLACYTLLPGDLIPKYGAIPVTGCAMLIGGCVLSLLVRVWNIPFNLHGADWLAAGGVVIVGTLLAYTLYLQGVSDIGAVKASLLSSVEPVSATLFSVLWLGTPFALMDLAGFVCIMATVFLLSNKKE